MVYTNDLGKVLRDTSFICVGIHYRNINKPFWLAKLSKVTVGSVEAPHNWVEVGRLYIGHLNEVRLAYKARSKQGIREAKGTAKREIVTNLVEALLEHNSKDVWGKWKRSLDILTIM